MNHYDITETNTRGKKWCVFYVVFRTGPMTCHEVFFLSGHVQVVVQMPYSSPMPPTQTWLLAKWMWLRLACVKLSGNLQITDFPECPSPPSPTPDLLFVLRSQWRACSLAGGRPEGAVTVRYRAQASGQPGSGHAEQLGEGDPPGQGHSLQVHGLRQGWQWHGGGAHSHQSQR